MPTRFTGPEGSRISALAHYPVEHLLDLGGGPEATLTGAEAGGIELSGDAGQRLALLPK